MENLFTKVDSAMLLLLECIYICLIIVLDLISLFVSVKLLASLQSKRTAMEKEKLSPENKKDQKNKGKTPQCWSALCKKVDMRSYNRYLLPCLVGLIIVWMVHLSTREIGREGEGERCNGQMIYDWCGNYKRWTTTHNTTNRTSSDKKNSNSNCSNVNGKLYHTHMRLNKLLHLMFNIN